MLFLELIEGTSLVVLLDIVLQGFPVTHGRHGSNGQGSASLVSVWEFTLGVKLSFRLVPFLDQPVWVTFNIHILYLD